MGVYSKQSLIYNILFYANFQFVALLSLNCCPPFLWCDMYVRYRLLLILETLRLDSFVILYTCCAKCISVRSLIGRVLDSLCSVLVSFTLTPWYAISSAFSCISWSLPFKDLFLVSLGVCHLKIVPLHPTQSHNS